MKIFNLGETLKALFTALFILKQIGAIGQIKGTLLNGISQEPVPFATIQATYTNKSERFLISDSNGVFIIDTAYLHAVRISCTGFTNLSQTTDLANALSWIFKLIPTEQTLEFVEIRSTRPLVEGNVSQITYNVVRDLTLKGRNAAEAVARLPFISINASNNISYKNGRSFIVLVNGSRFGMLSNDPNAALKAIPSSMIQTIELIFDPPLEYRLRGYDAVINIKTLPGYYKGMLGSVNGSVSSIGEWESEPYLSFQHNQTYIQLTYALRGYDLDKSFVSDYSQTGSNVFTRQTNSFNTQANAGRLGLSLDQRLSTRSRAGVYVNYYRSGYRDQGLSNISTTKSGISDLLEGATQLKGRKDYVEAGADFNKNYGSSKSNYSILIKYYCETSRSNSWSGLEPLYSNRFRQRPTEFSLQLANSHLIRKSLTFESVLKLTHRRADTYFVKDSLVGNHWIATDAEQSGVVSFNIATLSNSIAYATKKVSIRAVLSADYAAYRIESRSAPYSVDVLNLLPLASIRILVGKDKYLSLAYRSKLYRPTYESLTSIVPNYDPLVIVAGNPQLGTQVGHRIAPEYSFYFGKQGSSIYTTLELDFSNSFFNKYSLFDSAAKKRIISYRQSKYRSLYLVVGGELEYSSKWSSTGSFRAGFTTLGDNVSAAPIYSLYHSILFKATANSGVQLLIDYNSRFVTSMGYLTGYATYEFNLYRYFFDRKLQLNLAVSNFLQKERVQTERIQGASFQIDNIYRQPFRSFQLSASFRFGRLKTFAMNAKKLSNNDFKKID